MKKKVCVIERRGSQKYRGVYALIKWLRHNDYDVVVVTITGVAEAQAQAAAHRRLMPFGAVCMDGEQWDSWEEAKAICRTLTTSLTPGFSIVEHFGQVGQSPEEVSIAFLEKYLGKS